MNSDSVTPLRLATVLTARTRRTRFVVIALLAAAVSSAIANSLSAAEPADKKMPKGGSTKAAAAKGKESIGKGMIAVLPAKDRVTSEVEGALMRELARQALLVAAEDELGLLTLDGSIGESIPAESSGVSAFIVNTTAHKKSPAAGAGKDAPATYQLKVKITQPKSVERGLKWESTPLPLTGTDWMEPLATYAESLSRESFVAALRQAGIEPSPTGDAKEETAEVPEDKLDFVSQFARIQTLKARLRVKESAELLGDLVRAYANLASLTDFHWNSSSKAYRARSLIYAERLVAKYEATSFSLAHRAYALALAGRHLSALQMVKAARDADGAKAPGWLDLIAAYCEYQPETLKKHPDDLRELALYLRMRMAEKSFGNEDPYAIAQELIGINASNFYTAELMSGGNHFIMRRISTERVFGQMWPFVYRRLSTLPHFPQAAKPVAEDAAETKRVGVPEYETRVELMRSLAASTKDRPGPSWPAMADLLQEVSFIQAWRTLDMQLETLGWDTEPALVGFLPLCEGHKLGKFLSLFSTDRDVVNRTLLELKGEVDRTKFEVRSLSLVARASRGPGRAPAEADRLGHFVVSNTDAIYEDVLQLLAVSTRRDGRKLLDISPHWPAAIIDAIQRDPTLPLAEWEEKYGKYSSVLRAIHQRYLALNQMPDAIRCLKKALEIQPSSSGSIQLAELYRASGDEAAWFKAMEDGLKAPDSGLQHADIHQQLANWLMDRGKFEEAGPHARGAAASYSAWGLQVGARWAESVRDWKAAETYVSNMSRRYAGTNQAYYFWCVRTGHGDRQDAKALADEYWESLPEGKDPHTEWELTIATIVDGDRDEAKECLRAIYNSHKFIVALIYEALMADEDGDAESRDELFKEIETSPFAPIEYQELINSFRCVLKETEKGKWDPGVLEMLVTQSNIANVQYLYLLAGKFLAQHGEKELAEAYLQCAATSNSSEHKGAVLAGYELSRQKIEIGITRATDAPAELSRLTELIQNSVVAHSRNQLDLAEKMLDEALKIRPDFLPALVSRAMLYERREKYAKAIADLEQAIQIDSNFYYAHNQLARILSTCEEAEFRNGKKALEHAKLATDLRGFETWVSVSALASAYAECGQFDKAVELEKRAGGRGIEGPAS